MRILHGDVMVLNYVLTNWEGACLRTCVRYAARMANWLVGRVNGEDSPEQKRHLAWPKL